MKLKKYLYPIILLVLLLGSIVPTSGFWGGEQNYVADDNSLYKFSMRVEAPLSWPEGQRNTVRVNVTLDKSPDNISGLRIIYIIFLLQAEVGGQEGTPVGNGFLAVNEETRTVGKTVQYNTTLETPELANQFQLNVTLAAVVTGNDTTQDPANPRLYEYIFPETLNKDSQQVQVFVDLYGFPPASFLGRWMLVILPFTLVMASPSIYGIISSSLSRKPKEGETEEDGGSEQ